MEEFISDEPYYQEESPKVKKLKEKLEKEQKKLEEIKMIDNFDEEVEENKGLLKRNNRIVLKLGGFRILVFLFVFWTIIIIGAVGYLVYLGYNNHWSIDMLKPNFNNNFNLSNQYDFNPTTNNQYTHNIDARDYDSINIQNNVTIKICNGTVC